MPEGKLSNNEGFTGKMQFSRVQCMQIMFHKQKFMKGSNSFGLSITSSWLDNTIINYAVVRHFEKGKFMELIRIYDYSSCFCFSLPLSVLMAFVGDPHLADMQQYFQ